MQKTIFHLEVPDFSVAVERVRYPSLATRAVIIANPGNARAQVLEVSREGRESGIIPGTKLLAALRLCPTATVLPPDRALYNRATAAMGKALGNFTPIFETSFDGRFFLDMTGAARLFGPARDSAAKIRKEVSQRLLLPAGMGIAINKSVSEVASSVIHGDLLDVIPGCEKSFLSPWEVARLPGAASVDDPRLFDDLNIKRIGQLAGYPVGHLTSVFGKMGLVLNQRSHGIDPRPVVPKGKRPVVMEEEILEADTNSKDRLEAHLFILTERCGYRLRSLGQAPKTLSLTVGYSDNLSINGKTRIWPPTFDDAPLFDFVRKLFSRVARRRVRVRYLNLSFGDLSGMGRQLPLLPDRGKEIREKALTGAMDIIRNRFGVKAISRGTAA